MSDDGPKKTVIRPMPGGAFGGPDKGAGPGPGGPAGGGQKTVIGGAPPAGGQGGWGGPGQGGGGGAGGGWPGGGGGGGGGAPAPGGGWGGGGGGGQDQGFSGQDSGFGGQDSGFGGSPQGGGNEWMGAKPKDQGFFPEMRKNQPVQRAPVKKISLDAALSAKTSGMSAESNPIVAAAASLLVLFGRLRSQVVDMHAVPLMQHVTEEIEEFEREVLAAGVEEQDAMVAKYCLCGTADDIVQNLPGTDRAVWLQYSMSARFFNKRTAGVGFFQEVDRALQNPIQKYYLLELMLICLQLGFEGQYRAMGGGDVELQNYRRGIYDALRRVKPRGDDDISPRWKGVEIAARRAFSRFPVWAIALMLSGVLAGAYFLMRFLLIDEGDELAGDMRLVHPASQIELVRQTTGPITPPPLPVVTEETQSQLDRLSEGLADLLATGDVKLLKKGDFIVLDVNNKVLFASGSDVVKEEFTAIAGQIATVLDSEPGPIRVVGHTDADKLSGRGKYKNNFELSVGRAKAAAAVFSPLLAEPERVEVDGRGEDEPVAPNDSPENKALNRRVEIMIQREDTL